MGAGCSAGGSGREARRAAVRVGEARSVRRVVRTPGREVGWVGRRAGAGGDGRDAMIAVDSK